MNYDALFWLLATIFWTALMSFYSTQEMACLSFNRVRLEYCVTCNYTWARWLQELLSHPTKLLTTTLIGVNVALMASSECARRIFEAYGYNPNLAPIVHIPFVLLFGELVPMFAARVYAEHVSKLGISFLYFSSRLLTPCIILVDFFFSRLRKVVAGKKKETSIFLNRDELQKLLEEHETGPVSSQELQLTAMVGNIFSLRNKTAGLLMERLEYIPCVASNASIGQARKLFSQKETRFVVVYHKNVQKIVGILFPHDVVNAQDSKKVGEISESAFFIPETTQAIDLLKELEKEKVSVACVLNQQGDAQGVVTYDDILDEVLTPLDEKKIAKKKNLKYLERTFSAQTKIRDFNEAYGFSLDDQGCVVFADLIEKTLGRHASQNDIVLIDPLEIIIKETSLFKPKTILIRSKKY